MLDDNACYEITVKNPHDGTESTYKIPWDANIFDWGHIFKVILNWVQFHKDNIDELFGEEEEVENDRRED